MFPLRNMLLFIRNRYHPLWQLRKLRAFHRLTHYLDVPVAIRFSLVPHKIYVSLSKNLSYVLSGGEAGEELERANFGLLCKIGSFQRFADVGANIGLYGFIFSAAVKNGKVTMFEPDETNANLILRTITHKGVPDIKLVQAAVSDSEGTLTFYVDDLSGATGSIERGANSDSFSDVHHNYTPSGVKVRSVTLDKTYADFEDPDFIKIDVEGAELRVLQGTVGVIARSSPAIFFECDDNRELVQSFLADRGYVFFDFSSMQPISTLAHNSLALHSVKHAPILQIINRLSPDHNTMYQV